MPSTKTVVRSTKKSKKPTSKKTTKTQPASPHERKLEAYVTKLGERAARNQKLAENAVENLASFVANNDLTGAQKAETLSLLFRRLVRIEVESQYTAQNCEAKS